MAKIKVSHTIDEELVKSLDYEIKNGRFANMSHAIEYAIRQLIVKPEEWVCRPDILTKENPNNQNYVQTNSKCFERNAIITLTPIALDQRIDVIGIKLKLKHADNNDISDDTILTLRKGDKYIGNYSEIGKYEYGDLKNKVTLSNKASLSFNEILAIYLEESYVGKEIISETIKFYVNSCFKENTRKSPFDF